MLDSDNLEDLGNTTSKKIDLNELDESILKAIDEVNDEETFTGDGRFTLFQFPNTLKSSKRESLCLNYCKQLTNIDKLKSIFDKKNDRIFCKAVHDDNIVKDIYKQIYFTAMFDKAVVFISVDGKNMFDSEKGYESIKSFRINDICDQFISWYTLQLNVMVDLKKLNFREFPKNLIKKYPPYFIGFRFEDCKHSGLNIGDIKKLPLYPDERFLEIWAVKIAFDIKSIIRNNYPEHIQAKYEDYISGLYINKNNIDKIKIDRLLTCLIGGENG